MPTAAQTLGKFVADLKLADLPPDVLEGAKICMIDTVAVAAFGAQLPWSLGMADYARRYGSGGPCSIIGSPGTRVHAPFAALANGTFSHAFEQDCTFDPGVGTHPAATVLPAILALCEENGADGKTAIEAFVAGCEILFRVGGASYHSRVQPETLGFHLPGLTGPYGAAVAAGKVLGLNAEQLTNAIGIAGSLSAGIVAFTKSQQGGMVKRMHIGRTAESGVLAARLAADGYTGPETVLEGKFGFLEAYCRDGEPQRLTADLGSVWGCRRICMKRYPFHQSPQTAVQSVRELMSEHGFTGTDVANIVVEVGSKKTISHNNITEPGDIMQGQYSVPFCVGLALFRDPEDPRSFADDSALEDQRIRDACRNVELRPFAEGVEHTRKSSRIIVKLKNGKEYERTGHTFKGMPENPLTLEEMRHKFMLQTASMGKAAATPIFERMARLESEPRFYL